VTSKPLLPITAQGAAVEAEALTATLNAVDRHRRRPAPAEIVLVDPHVTLRTGPAALGNQVGMTLANPAGLGSVGLVVEEAEEAEEVSEAAEEAEEAGELSMKERAMGHPKRHTHIPVGTHTRSRVSSSRIGRRLLLRLSTVTLLRATTTRAAPRRTLPTQVSITNLSETSRTLRLPVDPIVVAEVVEVRVVEDTAIVVAELTAVVVVASIVRRGSE